MSEKEAERLGIMKGLDRGTLTIQKASHELGLSIRQIKRIRKRYRHDGVQGLFSKRKGCPSPNSISQDLHNYVLQILKEQFPDFGPTLAQEKLKELYNIDISRETIRKWMIQSALWKLKIRKKIKVYQRRMRRVSFGELIQADGSPHDWFEGRGERCCLILFVDDATSQITAGKFFQAETTEGYLTCLQDHLLKYGRPIAFYVDKHSIFRVNRDQVSTSGITHFGKVLKGLDIELICANSPQAKGRVERKNAVLQDRLVKEMRIQGINTIDEANRFLETYIVEHNQKFGKEPLCQKDAHRQMRTSDNLDKLFSYHVQRKLSKNLTFQYQNLLYQLKTDTPNRLRFAMVDIFWRPGEPIKVEYKSTPQKYTTWKDQAPERACVIDTKELETNWRPRNIRKPTLNHPWRQSIRKTA